MQRAGDLGSRQLWVSHLEPRWNCSSAPIWGVAALFFFSLIPPARLVARCLGWRGRSAPSPLTLPGGVSPEPPLPGFPPWKSRVWHAGASEVTFPWRRAFTWASDVQFCCFFS